MAYGAGLRASEVLALKVSDIDSARMTLRVEQGKGRKDRYAMLSPVLLQRLRAGWRAGHAQGKMLHKGWLFPGHNPIDPMSTRHSTASVTPPPPPRGSTRVSMHPLRHSYATHLLEQKVGYPGDPGAARAQAASSHSTVCPGSHQPPAGR